MSKLQYSSNYLKHTSKNPIQKFLINNFYNSLVSLAKPLNPISILDAGCGEGFSLAKLSEKGIGKNLLGIDGSESALKLGRKLFPSLTLTYGNIYSLPYKDNSFDLVVCTEVLEHLEKAEKAFSEVLRATKKYAIFSVPHEPFFMLSNLLRGKDILRFGNNIEHINHWNVFTFKKFIKSNRAQIIKTKLPFPWIMILVKKPNQY